jgi:hypothetical protein
MSGQTAIMENNKKGYESRRDALSASRLITKMSALLRH